MQEDFGSLKTQNTCKKKREKQLANGHKPHTHTHTHKIHNYMRVYMLMHINKYAYIKSLLKHTYTTARHKLQTQKKKNTPMCNKSAEITFGSLAATGWGFSLPDLSEGKWGQRIEGIHIYIHMHSLILSLTIYTSVSPAPCLSLSQGNMGSSHPCQETHWSWKRHYTSNWSADQHIAKALRCISPGPFAIQYQSI